MKNVKYRLSFPINLLFSIIVYYVIYIVVKWRVDSEFGHMTKNVNVMQSVTEYYALLSRCMLAALLFTLVWWGVSWIKTDIREVFERNTLLLAVVFCAVLWMIIMLLNQGKNVISDNYGNPYQFMYTYCLCSGFAFNLFCFPPENVRMVMCFGRTAGRLIAAAIMLVLTIILLFI